MECVQKNSIKAKTMKIKQFLIISLLIFGFQNAFAQDVQKWPGQEPEYFQISLFPNPSFDGNFTIKSSDAISSIEVLNVIGRSLYKKNNENEATYEHYIQLDNYDNGLYLIKIAHISNPDVVIKKLLLK